jgi:hypothetical protein
LKLTHVRLLVSENPGYAEFPVSTECARAIFPREEMANVVDLRPTGDAVLVALEVEDVDDTVVLSVPAGSRSRTRRTVPTGASGCRTSTTPTAT